VLSSGYSSATKSLTRFERLLVYFSFRELAPPYMQEVDVEMYGGEGTIAGRNSIK